MNRYQDEFGIYHDKAGNISGNGVLYSAYALQLGLYSPEDIFKVGSMFPELVSQDEVLNLIYTKRYFDNEAPDSLDNLVGFIRWDTLSYRDYEKAGWYFRGSKDSYKQYSWFQFIKTSWKYRKQLKEDRNYFHENDLPEIGKLAYWIPWQYRYYMKRRRGESAGLIETVAFYTHVLFTSRIKKTSPKNIAVLMLEDLGSKCLIKLFNKKRQYKEYFGEEHPFYKEVE